MGLLSTGTSLTWEEIEQWAAFIKEHGIQQFINIFNEVKNRKNDLMKYGDEVCNIDLNNLTIIISLKFSF